MSSVTVRLFSHKAEQFSSLACRYQSIRREFFRAVEEELPLVSHKPVPSAKMKLREFTRESVDKMRWKQRTSLADSPATWVRVLRAVGSAVVWVVLALLTLWATAALFVDCRIAALRIPLTLIYVLGVIAVFISSDDLVGLRSRISWAFVSCSRGGSPSNPRTMAIGNPTWIEPPGLNLNRDRVTIHNLRNCDYRTETDYSNCWSDRTIYLSEIRAADLFLTNWGISFASHPIVSFQFGDNQHVAFSIEARYKAGQEYSTIRGCFRQYGLIFVVADERDVIRLRTNYRKDEEVYMYRIQVQPDVARAMFFTYITYLNKLKDHPEWYNELTRNCTTTLQKPLAADTKNPQPWSYKYILNGTLDELLYDRGRLVTDGLPFSQLKQLEHINAAARAADASPDFSALIRTGRIGFGPTIAIENQ